MRAQPARPYHHGDLRPALLRAAVEVIGQAGPAAMSLREVARRAGVTHAAAAYHFGDKAGLLTAVAAQGYRMLTEKLRGARGARRGFLEVGVAYMRFAVSHRAHFEVMYQPELYRRDDAEVREARAAAAVLLYGTASPDPGQLAAGAAAWSLVHGLATLWLNGNLPPQLGDDPEEITRQVASYLSIPANPGAPPQQLPAEQADPRAAASMRLAAGDRTDSARSQYWPAVRFVTERATVFVLSCLALPMTGGEDGQTRSRRRQRRRQVDAPMHRYARPQAA